MITGRDLTVTVGGKRLLDGVSIDISPGHVVVVLGANGAGKSTLLKTLSGEIRPSEGCVTINGRPISSLGALERARQLAVLPQESLLSADFLVHEVVLLGRTPHISSRATESDRRIVLETLAAAGVSHLLGRRYITLSGGERQRVHLARVLAQVWERSDQPRYLFLDEPTSSLDLAHQQRALGAARDFAGRGGGVMAILHDLNLAAQYADHIVLLRAGRVVAAGAPAEVLTPASIQTAFDLVAVVMRHPTLDCPLIVPIVGASRIGADDLSHELLAPKNRIEHIHASQSIQQ